MKNLLRISSVMLVILSIVLIHSCKLLEMDTPPVISTTSLSAITYTTAASGGEVTNEGGAAVTARGVCWNTSLEPTVSNNKTTDGTGIGSFTSSLTGLTAGTTYYIRAYATNSAGTGYGNQVSFSTLQIALATLTTTAITSITQTTAVTGGNITTDNGSSVTARGVCWGTATNPTIALSTKTTDGTGTGSFVSNLINLQPGTIYYVRSYATNSAGTAYGTQVSFTTSAAIVVPTLTTTAASSITSTTATSGGNISSDGGSSITARGVCWSTSSTPTTTNFKTTDGSGVGSFTSTLTGLSANTAYYLRAYATNSAGTAYGTQVSFTTTSVALAIGQSYQGGVIAYILQSGNLGYIAGQTHGIIAAPSDQSTGAVWGCSGTIILGADGTAIGTGNQNTIDIMAGCSTVGIAARLCGDLVLGGYSDWYLPSDVELQKLNLNRSTIGGFSGGLYWSSSEQSSDYAWSQYFNEVGTRYGYGKTTVMRVRAVRAF